MLDKIFVFVSVDFAQKSVAVIKGFLAVRTLYRDLKSGMSGWFSNSLLNELFFDNNSLGYLISANTNHFQGTYDLDVMKDFSNSSTGKVARFLFLHLYKRLSLGKRFFWWLLYLDIPKISKWLGIEPKVYDGIGKESIEGRNIICIGSPRNDELAKDVFENYNSFLPFHYVDGEDLGETRWRYIIGNRRDLKKYGIATKSLNGKEKFYYPSVGNSGFTESDYLLITKVPNPSSRTEDVIIFGGLHGTATESVSLLFSNKEILKSICEHTSKLGFHHFQTLIKVSEIKHCSKKRISIPKSIEHIQTIALHV